MATQKNNIKAIAPKKSLGQNFLTDKNYCRKIVDLLGDIDGCDVLEIGPGSGAITGIILEKGANLLSVDVDSRAIEHLQGVFAEYMPEKFNLLNMDIRQYDLYKHFQRTGKRLKVIGNIPYNISSEIFFWLFENTAYVETAVLTVQKEVAQRVTAPAGNKSYGIMTLALNLVGKGKIAFDIPPGVFYPPPKVTSSTFRMDFFDNPPSREYFNGIMKLIRASFNYRRKMLSNCFKVYCGSHGVEGLYEMFFNSNERIPVYMQMRAEQLDLADYEFLYSELKKLVENSGQTNG